jgi:hypothetical protein
MALLPGGPITHDNPRLKADQIMQPIDAKSQSWLKVI